MKNIIAIAKNTFLQTIRDRILYGIVAFAFIFIAFTLFLGSISLGKDIIIIKSLGLAALYLFSLIIVVFLGTSLLSKEIEKRTLYFIISKPVTHAQIVIGKFAGLLVSMIVTLSTMTIIYLLVVFIKGAGFDAPALVAVFLQICELAVFISLLILFSSFAAPLASILYAVLILYIGHSLGFLLEYATKVGGIIHYVSVIAYYIFPNFEKFNVRNSVIYGHLISMNDLLLTFLYALLWSIFALYLATAALKKREL